MITYLYGLFIDGKSYSVLNTHKVAITQTLIFCNSKWKENSILLTKFMKGAFNLKPAVPRYNFTWDVSILLEYLRKLSPLENLSLKLP